MDSHKTGALADDILKLLMPYIPMYSGILYDTERYSKNAKSETSFLGWRESFVEGFHRILKNSIFKEYACLAPQQFVQILDSSFRGRSSDYLNILQTELREKRKVKKVPGLLRDHNDRILSTIIDDESEEEFIENIETKPNVSQNHEEKPIHETTPDAALPLQIVKLRQ